MPPAVFISFLLWMFILFIFVGRISSNESHTWEYFDFCVFKCNIMPNVWGNFLNCILKLNFFGFLNPSMSVGNFVVKYMFSFSRSYWCPHFYLHEIWANVCIWIKSVESLSPLKALHTFVTNISMLKHEWTTHKINHLTLSLNSTFLNLCGLKRVAWMLSSVTFQIFANWSQYLVLCTILC